MLVEANRRRPIHRHGGAEELFAQTFSLQIPVRLLLLARDRCKMAISQGNPVQFLRGRQCHVGIADPVAPQDLFIGERVAVPARAGCSRGCHRPSFRLPTILLQEFCGPEEVHCPPGFPSFEP